MPAQAVPYPSGPDPDAVSLRATRPSPRACRLERLMALGLFGLFAGWLLLFAALLGFTIWCAASLATDSLFEQVGFGLLAVAGLVGLSAMVLSVRKASVPRLTGLELTDQPGLLDFLNRVADDSGAEPPRRVFVGVDVNAAVAMDVSPRNLLRPPGYDLYLGLGLVNGLNLSGLQAVLAHELGHMAGGPVRRWFRGVEEFAGLYLAGKPMLGRFHRVWLAARRELQREREFQADRIAAFVAGSEAVAAALEASAAGREALSQAVSELKPLAELGRATNDLFFHQHAAAELVAAETFEDDGDADHPGRGERIAALRAAAVPAEIDSRSPWLLLRDAQALRRQATASAVAAWPGLPAALSVLDPRTIQKQIVSGRELSELPEKYRSLYRNRPPILTLEKLKQWRDHALAEPWLDPAEPVVSDVHRQRLAKRELLHGQRRRMLRGTARATGAGLVQAFRELNERLDAIDREFEPFDELGAVQHFSLAFQCGRDTFDEALAAADDYTRTRQVALHAQHQLRTLRIFSFASLQAGSDAAFFAEYVAALRAAQGVLARCCGEAALIDEEPVSPLPPGPLDPMWIRKLTLQLDAAGRAAQKRMRESLIRLLDHRESVRERFLENNDGRPALAAVSG